MISSQLNHSFKLIEILTFPIWQQANEKERERIARELGEMEAKMIMEEIEKECEIKFHEQKTLLYKNSRDENID